jgi:hypothetical protein
MGSDVLINWISPELALAYFIAVVIAMLGLLQIVATHGERQDLRWLPAGTALPVGVLTTVGATAWLYTQYYDLIFVPGPAGTELVILFGGGTAVAVWLTRALHWLSSLMGRSSTAQRADPHETSN